MLKIKIITLICILLLGLVKESGAWTIGLEPFFTELKAFPGTYKTFEVTIFISQKKEARIKIYTTDYLIERNGEIKYPPPETSKYSCANWIKLEPKGEMIVKEADKMKVKCTVMIPRGTKIGGRYAAIMCETLPEKKGEGGITAHYRIASLVYLTIGYRGFTEKLGIKDLDITKEKENTVFNLALENEGNIHIVADKGMVLIKSRQGRIITQTPLVSNTYTMLPEDIRDFKGIFTQRLPDGNYTAEIRIPYGEEKYGKRKMIINKANIQVKKGIVTKRIGEEVVEEYLNFYTSPTAIKVNVPPNGFRAGVINIFNEEPIPIHINTKLKDAYIDERGQIKYLEAGTTSYSCQKYLQLSPTSLSIPGNSKGYIKYTVSISKDKKGGKYGAILFSATCPDKKVGETDIPIGIIIPNTLEENLTLTDLEISSLEQQLKISFLLTNTGNVSLEPTGGIIVQTEGGRKIDEILLKEGIIILPGGRRKVEILHTHNLTPREYIAVCNINYGEKKSIEGKKDFVVKRK